MTPVFRIVISILAILLCLLVGINSAKFGFSKLIGRYAVVAKSIPAAAEAVRIAPADADAHRALAVTFQNVQMYREAERELAVATTLRPKDDFLWLELGTARDQIDNAEGALFALDRAVEFAPYYAHTHWQRGNLRLRMGQTTEAFRELREAAKSNHEYLPTLIDLAWGLSRGDVKVTEESAGIDSTEERIAFARYLATRGKGPETYLQFQIVANSITDTQRRELVRHLIANKEYRDAFAIWNKSLNENTGSQFNDGGFEDAITFDEAGFGWKVSRENSNLTLSVDTSDKDSGVRSLRVAYNGTSATNVAILSQTIIVKPQQKYRISFSHKSNEIVSGGLPLISVTDLQSSQIVSKSKSLPQGSTAWQKQSLEFVTSPLCEAIEVKLIRNECQSTPCPIFGVIWLDSFLIEESK